VALARRIVPLLLAMAAAAVALPAAAAAADVTLTLARPDPAATLDAGWSAPFAVRLDGVAARVSILVSASDAVGTTGVLDPKDGVATGTAEPSPLDPALYQWVAASSWSFLHRPGVYHWQAIATDATGDALLGASPIAEVTVALPAAAGRRDRIAASVGRQGAGGFLRSTRNVPDRVDAGRFAAILGTSARRWGLRPQGPTPLVAGRADGHNVVGFSSAIQPGALGVQRDRIVRYYRRARRCLVYRTAAGQVVKRQCVLGAPRYVGSRVAERDIVLDPGVRWQAGPDYPGGEEYDLETVLLHELGHFAGNKAHVKRCQNSPMLDALAAGEWWRTPGDWYVNCASSGGRLAGTAALGRPRPRALRVERVVIARIVLASR